MDNSDELCFSMGEIIMKENMQGRFCPYCGEWNSFANKQCKACGLEIPNTSHGSTSGGNRLPVVLLVCCVLVLAAGAIGYYISSVIGPSKGPDPGAESDSSSGNAVVTEIPQVSPDAEDVGYTAPPIPLTSFGGETAGNQLKIHSHVHDNYNNEYSEGLGGTNSNVENITEYLIGNQYRYFSFRIVLNYERRTDYHKDTYVRIYADGNKIYQSEIVRSGYKPTDVTLDMRGVEKLQVSICGSGDIRIVDAVLHNDEGFEQYSTMIPYTNKTDLSSVSLSHLQYWNGSSAEGGLRYISGTIKDSTGQLYDGAFAGTHENQDNWVEYDITDCGFKKLCGTIMMNTDSGGADTVTPIVAVYNGPWLEQLYKSEPVTNGSRNQYFEVDLKNSTQFRLQISGKYNIRLVNCYLYK